MLFLNLRDSGQIEKIHILNVLAWGLVPRHFTIVIFRKSESLESLESRDICFVVLQKVSKLVFFFSLCGSRQMRKIDVQNVLAWGFVPRHFTTVIFRNNFESRDISGVSKSVQTGVIFQFGPWWTNWKNPRPKCPGMGTCTKTFYYCDTSTSKCRKS